MTKIEDELRQQVSEPFLPIESKLVGWSFGLGVVLLAVLAVISRLFPVT